MPLYDFDCPGCGQSFEKRVSLSQLDEVNCPNCGGQHVNRKMGTFAIRGQSSGRESAPVTVPTGGL